MIYRCLGIVSYPSGETPKTSFWNLFGVFDWFRGGTEEIPILLAPVATAESGVLMHSILDEFR